MTEFAYISWLRSQTPAHPRVLIGPGDDCAAIAPPTRPLLVTVDMLMDGTDFHVAEVGPRRAGRKAMAANLSDVAAMAGVPTAAVVSVAVPRSPLPPLRGERGGGEGWGGFGVAKPPHPSPSPPKRGRGERGRGPVPRPPRGGRRLRRAAR